MAGPDSGIEVVENKRAYPLCSDIQSIHCDLCRQMNFSDSRFCGNCGANLNGAAAAALSSAPASLIARLSASNAELRQVTVVFCDLVGSTALSSHMDPEDLREIVLAYQWCVAETVRHFDGFVARHMGDGVLAYFGYPHAQEDDAERAVRAGLEVIRAVSGLKFAAPLQARVGIATGLVVVGHLIGSGEAQERSIVGETPNLAARLQAIAEPNAVVIAESTRKLVGNLFELRDLGPHALKGIGERVRAWVALWPNTIESRFDALRGIRLTALVGREEETDILLRRWQRAQAGEGQVVLLSGEPGIGKSRLTAWLLDRIAGEPHTRLRYFCSPHHADSALYPVIGQLERAAGFQADDDATSRLDKLNALLAEVSISGDDAALIADLLSVPNPSGHSILELTPQERRQKTHQALIAQLKAQARRGPVLMIFEDVHWIDPTTLELLGRTIECLRSIPVLLVLTFRPEFNPPWPKLSHVATLTLNRLAAREVGQMIERIVGNRTLPAEVVSEIVRRTDGVPLFVEEMTKAVLEFSKGDVEAGCSASALSSSALPVPASLHALLMARLDRLGFAKRVAQIGSAIGPQFPYELARAVARCSDSELKAALDRLGDANVVFCQGVPPHATYCFKHALVQDAAYGTLLRGPRQELHARIATALRENSPDTSKTQPETLAHHYAEAGLIEQAASFWGKAGQRSVERSALIEAVAQLRKALHLMASLPTTPALRREQVKLQATLASTLIHVKGYSSPEVIVAFEQAGAMIEHAMSLDEPPEDPLLRFSVMYGLWASSYVAIDLDTALARARQFLTAAEAPDATTAPRVIGNRLMGTTLMMLGQFESAQAHLDRAIALYVPAQHRPLAARFGQGIGATVLAYRAWTLWPLGYPEAALRNAYGLIENGRELNHAGTLMYALFHAAVTKILSGQVAAAETDARELIALAEEKGASLWRALGTLVQGWTLLTARRAVDAARLIEIGLTDHEATGAASFRPIFLTALARAYAECHELDRAQNTIAKALATAEETNERWAESEIHRTAGQILLGMDEAPEAEARFRRSIRIARGQRARSWELRASTSLAQLCYRQRKPVEARELLAPVYSWFSEGLDTSDLTEAAALLNELR
jgi:class 3 adenylate cyclase/predicted ATPase